MYLTPETNRKKSSRRVLFSISLFLGVLFSALPQPAQAQYWGTTNIFADLMMNVIETAQRQMEGAVLATLKMAAVQLVNNQVGQAIGGSALGQALFITNFNDFLYQAPAQKTELYMNDFFTLTTRGKASQANYVGVGDTTAIGDSYATYLKTLAEQATIKKPAALQTNLEEYTANPATMFAEGDFRAFNAFFSNPANNPFGYSLQAEQVYQKKLAEEQNAATIKATSSGFLPGETKGGSVTAPAGSIEALQTNAQNLPNLVLAAAQNPGELASGIVSAMANKVITNLIQKGVGEVQTSIQREINGVNGEVNGTIAKLRQAVGPGVQFLNTATQRLDVKVKPAQPPVISSGTRTSFTAGSDVDAIPYYPGGSNDPDDETSGGGRSGGGEDVDTGIGVDASAPVPFSGMFQGTLAERIAEVKRMYPNGPNLGDPVQWMYAMSILNGFPLPNRETPSGFKSYWTRIMELRPDAYINPSNYF
jgi:hypothetical protein